MKKYRILACHNYYQRPGGEDLSFQAEVDLLRANGHEVETYTVHNVQINNMSKIAAAVKTIWNPDTHRTITNILRKFRPDVLHCTNTFPLLSPSIYYATQAQKIPIVQSLRNYRHICPGATLLRAGSICELCVGRSIAFPAIRHACYKGSRAGSVVVTALNTFHQLSGTWSNKIDLYYATSRFTRNQYIKAGFPASKIAVKPNFVRPDAHVGSGEGGYAIFAGRLAEEKDIDTLIGAWRIVSPNIKLMILGDGPKSNEVKKATSLPNIQWLGHRSTREVAQLVRDAACLIMTSCWYEPFGRTVIEAFAVGTPVISTRIGALEELIDDGVNGLFFERKNPSDLARKILHFFSNTEKHMEMRTAARLTYEAHYTPEKNYPMLMDIYDRACSIHSRSAGFDKKIV